MKVSNDSCNKVNMSYLILKFTYGLLFVIAGLDKFLNLITNWSKYISEYVYKTLSPIIGSVTMFQEYYVNYTIGIIEIIIGALILIPGWTKTGACLATLWLLVIIINLLTFNNYYDIAVRDAAMAMGTWVLSLLAVAVDEMHTEGNNH